MTVSRAAGAESGSFDGASIATSPFSASSVGTGAGSASEDDGGGTGVAWSRHPVPSEGDGSATVPDWILVATVGLGPDELRGIWSPIGWDGDAGFSIGKVGAEVKGRVLLGSRLVGLPAN